MTAPRAVTEARGRDLLGRVVRGAVRHPLRTMVTWLCVAVACGAGASRIQIDTTTTSFLDREDPAWTLYQRSLEEFGGDEFLTIALEGDEPFDPDVLEAIHQLTEQLERLPGVRRVDSLRTVPNIAALPDGSIDLEPALFEVPRSAEALAELRARVRGDRIAPGTLVSADERVFAINVLFDEDVEGPRDVAVAVAERLLAGREAWMSGVPVFRTKVNDRTRVELFSFVPLTLLLVGIVILLAFRGIWSVGIALGTAGLGCAVVFGAMGVSGVSVSLSTAILPPILLALGCAYVMHVLTAARGIATPEELEEAVSEVAGPIAISGLTTVIGFLAMATVRVTAIRELASMGAVGVLGVLAAALTFAPAMLRLRGVREASTALDGWIRDSLRHALVGFVTRRARVVVIAWTGVAAVFGLGLARLHVETDIILWFPHGTEIRDSYEAIRERLSGITPMNVVVRSSDGRAVTDPPVLAAIASLASHLESRDDVARALSVTDPLRQIHAGFSGRPDAGLPASRSQAEQYLELLASMDRLRDLVSDDRESANMPLRVDVNGSRRLIAIGTAVEEWWAENGVPDFSVETTGIMYEFGRAEEEIAYGQIRGLAFAFGAIGAILFAVLRAPLSTVGALLPNVLPLFVAYGFLGLAGIPLDAATVCLGCIVLGVAVDDTVHVVTRYGSARAAGKAPTDALSLTFERVLPALVFTSAAVTAGFIALGISEFTLVQHFGFVTAGMVVVCLLADLTLLPALLVAADRGRSKS